MSWSTYHRQSRWAGWGRILKRTWEFTWKGGLTLLIPLLLVIGWYAWQAGKYDLTVVERIPARTVLLDRTGQEIGTIHGENRRLVNYEDIPEFFKTCLFAREDSRFIDHEGVDLRGLARATVRNIKDREMTEGASTLSMQLARNSFDLTRERSLNRKFLEIALTYRIESRFTKKEILTHYLNRIYFGSGCHGIEEAALTYFGKSTPELDEGQCALLAGIIRAPHACSPRRNPEGAIKQRDEVLARLVTIGEVSAKEAEVIKKTPLGLQDPTAAITGTNHGTRVMRRPLEVVLDEVQMSEGGLEVETTLNLTMQQELETLIHSTDFPEGSQVAGLALDPTDGGVLAVVGCREKMPTGWNRALDSRRDLGPTLIEPLITTVAMERGHLPVKGNPVATGRQLEQEDARKLLKRFGFEGTFGRGDDLYRGTLSVSLLELARAYATLEQEGRRPEPIYVRTLAKDGKELFRRTADHFPAFSKHAIPGNSQDFLNGPSLPKTDYWLAYRSAERVIVMWVGYDQPKKFSLPDIVVNRLREQLKKIAAK